MSAYKILLQKLSQAPAENWRNPFGYEHSTCTINGVVITLYKIGWIRFAEKIYEGWPTSRAGRKLFKQIRPRDIPYDQPSLERTEFAKLNISEEIHP